MEQRTSKVNKVEDPIAVDKTPARADGHILARQVNLQSVLEN